MSEALRVPAAIVTTLSFEYSSQPERLFDLYESAKRSQWNASTDIAWDVPVVPFGSPLAENSTFSESARAASPLAHGGKALWDRFRWEHQAFLVSQFLHGEQGALAAAARLAEVLPDMSAKCFAATQAADEARHMEAFARYLREHVPEPYGVVPPLAGLLEDVLGAREWDITVLGMQVVIEPLALGAFRLAEATLHDRLIAQIVRYVAVDEARHVAFGVHLLRERLAGLSESERAVREDFVLSAAQLMLERMLLEDVWERLGVPRAEGVAFARKSEMMILYRKTMFSKVVTMLVQLEFMTPRIRAGLSRLGLLRAS